MNRVNEISCENFPQSVWFYQEHSLAPEIHKQWEAHLSGCATCRGTLAEIEHVLETCEKLPERDAPETVIQEAITRALRSRSAAGNGRFSIFRTPLVAGFLWKPALAAAVLIAAYFSFWGRPEQPGSSWEALEIDAALSVLDKTLTVQEKAFSFNARWDEEARSLDAEISVLMDQVTGGNL